MPEAHTISIKTFSVGGDMVALTGKIDALLGSGGNPGTIKTLDDVIKHWDELKAIAKEVISGIQGYTDSHGDINKYAKSNWPMTVSRAKSIFGLTKMNEAELM
jgi:hypothetical protein